MKFHVFAIIAMLLVAVALAGVQAGEEGRVGARGRRWASRRGDELIQGRQEDDTFGRAGGRGVGGGVVGGGGRQVRGGLDLIQGRQEDDSFGISRAFRRAGGGGGGGGAGGGVGGGGGRQVRVGLDLIQGRVAGLEKLLARGVAGRGVVDGFLQAASGREGTL